MSGGGGSWGKMFEAFGRIVAAFIGPEVKRVRFTVKEELAGANDASSRL